MPYITKDQRMVLDESLINLIEDIKKVPNYENSTGGILNYIITYIMKSLTEDRKNYKNLSEMIATLECAKLEFYRKDVAPYEDIKELENGKV